jgi:hypothetical protein
LADEPEMGEEEKGCHRYFDWLSTQIAQIILSSAKRLSPQISQVPQIF